MLIGITNLIFILLLVAVAVFVAKFEWRILIARLRGMVEFDSLSAQKFIESKGPFILDVREQHEYDAGHIAKSKLIPLGGLESQIPELNEYKSRPILVVCRGGRRSAIACTLLKKNGFMQAYNLKGGVEAWKKATLPLEIVH